MSPRLRILCMSGNRGGIEFAFVELEATTDAAVTIHHPSECEHLSRRVICLAREQWMTTSTHESAFECVEEGS